MGSLGVLVVVVVAFVVLGFFLPLFWFVAAAVLVIGGGALVYASTHSKAGIDDEYGEWSGGAGSPTPAKDRQDEVRDAAREVTPEERSST